MHHKAFPLVQVRDKNAFLLVLVAQSGEYKQQKSMCYGNEIISLPATLDPVGWSMQPLSTDGHKPLNLNEECCDLRH